MVFGPVTAQLGTWWSGAYVAPPLSPIYVCISHWEMRILRTEALLVQYCTLKRSTLLSVPQGLIHQYLILPLHYIPWF